MLIKATITAVNILAVSDSQTRRMKTGTELL